MAARESENNVGRLITEAAEKHTFLFVFVLVSVVFLLYFKMFFPLFQTNDDVVMAMIASGTGVSSAPNEHLINTNVIIGQVLRGLYSAAPDLPWYGLYIVFVQFISYLAILYALLRTSFSWTRVFFFFLYAVAVLSHFFVNMQFTTTAFMAGQGGIFLLLNIFEPKAGFSGRDTVLWRMMVPAAFLLLLSALIRPDSFYLVLLLSVPLVLAKIYMAGDRKTQIRHILFITCVLILSLSAIRYNSYYYERDAGWKGFYSRINLISDFINDRRAVLNKETRHIFEEARWSPNDYLMLMNWFFADEELYSEARLRQILSNFTQHKFYADSTYITANLISIMKNHAVWIALYSAGCCLFFIERRRHVYGIIGMTFLMMLLLITVLIIFKRVPERTYLVMFSFVASAALYFVRENIVLSKEFFAGHNLQGGGLKYLALVIWLVMLIMTVTDRIGESQTNNLKNVVIKQAVKSASSDESRLYVVLGASFPYEYFSPFDNLRKHFRAFPLLGINTLSNTPINIEVMKKWGMKDVHTGIYQLENIVLLSDPYMNQLYRQYVLEHHHREIYFAPAGIGALPNAFRVVVKP